MDSQVKKLSRRGLLKSAGLAALGAAVGINLAKYGVAKVKEKWAAYFTVSYTMEGDGKSDPNLYIGGVPAGTASKPDFTLVKKHRPQIAPVFDNHGEPIRWERPGVFGGHSSSVRYAKVEAEPFSGEQTVNGWIHIRRKEDVPE